MTTLILLSVNKIIITVIFCYYYALTLFFCPSSHYAFSYGGKMDMFAAILMHAVYTKAWHALTNLYVC